MKCSYHSEREAISKCKVCGANLCDICDDFQGMHGYCSRCSANYNGKNYLTFSSGLKYNIVSLICAIMFLSFWIVCIFITNMSLTYLICGGIIALILLSVSISLLTVSIVNIKKIKRTAKQSLEKFIENQQKNYKN